MYIYIYSWNFILVYFFKQMYFKHVLCFFLKKFPLSSFVVVKSVKSTPSDALPYINLIIKLNISEKKKRRKKSVNEGETP